MSLDPVPAPSENGPVGHFDVSIPPAHRSETHKLRDKLVSSPVSLLIAVPVAGVVLIFRPEAAEAVLGAAVLLLTAMKNSRHRHQRRRWIQR